MPVSGQYARVDDECQTSRASGLKGAVLARTANKHLDSPGVPWAGGGGARAHSCVRVRAGAWVRVLSDGEAHDLAASLHCHSVHSAHPARVGVREAECDGVGAHRSIGKGIASSLRRKSLAVPTARRRDRPWLGTGGRRSAEAALGRCGGRGTRPAALVGFRKARPEGGQKANRWRWRRRSDSEGLFRATLRRTRRRKAPLPGKSC